MRIQVFMTRSDLQCVHEPFGDAFYYGELRNINHTSQSSHIRQGLNGLVVDTKMMRKVESRVGSRKVPSSQYLIEWQRNKRRSVVLFFAR